MDGGPPSAPAPPPQAGSPPAPPVPDEVPWRAREAILVALLALLASILLTLPISLLVSDEDLIVASIIVVIEVALAASAVLWVRQRHRRDASALGLERPDARAIGVGVLTGLLGLGLAQFVVGPIVIGIANALHDGPVELPAQLEFDRPGALVLAITGIGVVAVAPVAEEIFFRGFLFRAIRRWAGLQPAAVLSAAIFAAVHIQPLIMPSIFVLGVVLARAVERQGSLVPAIVAHAVFNAVGYTIFLVTL